MKKIVSAIALGMMFMSLFSGCNGIDNSLSDNLDSGIINSSENNMTQKDYWQDKINFGIQITSDGIMTLSNQPLFIAGVNSYNLFNQCLSDFSSTKAKAALDVLEEQGIKTVRFNCGGYDSSYLELYFSHKKEYISLLVEISAYAESKKIGLIPSFFWLYHAIPDYYDEPIKCWGKEDSKTIKFMTDYTFEIVRALKDSKAIFGWEFGNEFNLSCDLPNVAEHLPSLPPHSQRESRTEEDYLSATDVNFALKKFSETIREIDDTGRMITSGNATLRPSQYHQLHDNNWLQDSREEYAEITSVFTPGAMDTISEHVYFLSQTTFGEQLSLEEYLKEAVKAANKLKKAYFVGEWGGGDSTDYTYYRRIGNAFVDAGVQLVLLWNYNYEENSIEYSFSKETERGKELFKIVGEMNSRYENNLNS